MKLRLHLLLTLVFVSLLSFLEREALAEESAVDTERLLVEAWDAVRREFHDPRLNGVNWDQVLEDYFPRAEKASTPIRAHELVNAMIAELGASHTALLERNVYRLLTAELEGDRYLQTGCELEWREGGFFVRSLHEKGPAAKAGFMLGDRVVAVDGVVPQKSWQVADAGYDPGLPGPTIFYPLPETDRPMRFLLQRTPNPGSRLTVTVRPEKTNCLDTARNSLQVLEIGGYRFGLMHMWFLPMRGMDRILRDALRTKFRNCDGIVLDMRGRGGYDHMGRSVTNVLTQGRSKFDGPIVALMDERTRSAKELFAERFRRLGVGTLVGKRTEGAVIGAKFERLSNGSVLMIGGHRVRTATGKKLEGNGVAPDVEVMEGIVDYAEGRDPILEAGVAVILDQCRRAEVSNVIGSSAY